MDGNTKGRPEMQEGAKLLPQIDPQLDDMARIERTTLAKVPWYYMVINLHFLQKNVRIYRFSERFSITQRVDCGSVRLPSVLAAVFTFLTDFTSGYMYC